MHAIKAAVARVLPGVLRLGQRFGFNLTPNHFYSDIPDFRALERDPDWKRPWSMIGVAGADDLDAQAQRLEAWVGPCAERLTGGDLYTQACERNGEVGYGPIEAELLYCFVRSARPAQIVQVGCGVSTVLALMAADDEPGYAPRITCVEPYPTGVLQQEHKAGRIRLVPEKAQSVAMEVFTGLGPGDLLFVDSTHTVRTGSEVLRIIYEVMPRLPAGVFVHFHDIYFPFDYGPGLMKDIFFWRESALLHAFLCGNRDWTISVSMSMLHHARPDRVRAAMPNYRPRPMRGGLDDGEGHYPSATYLLKTR